MIKKQNLEKKVEITEITQEQFEDMFEDALSKAMDEYNELAKSWNRYQKDKQRFYIKYWKEKTTVYYTKHTKPRVGFHGDVKPNGKISSKK